MCLNVYIPAIVPIPPPNAVIINNKLIAALDANIFPILCFGENIDDDYHEAIPKILDKYLKDVENIEFIIFAYEPIFAIGTGALPNRKRIEEVISFVNEYLEDKYKKKPNYMVVLLIVVILMI